MKKLALILFVILLFSSCSQSINLNRVKGIRGNFAPKVTEQGVTFSVLAPDATLVTIAGNFNGWNSQTTPLSLKNDGVWAITLSLPKNHKYNYMFVIDGYWVADPDNPNTENNGNGTVNSVIFVK